MVFSITVCGIVAIISPWYFVGKTKGVQEKIRIIATENGEQISMFYGCRGCYQHVQFGKKYAPQLLKKLWIYDAGAILSFFIPAMIALSLIAR